ncbi:esterase E4-like isoform X2 [Lycorma delicatula]|uniref:esterase E4-like isoform X2 n=1 Tax=Lycorma delicatula TaxID=130591 RepID=UPI003F513D15
MMNMNSFLNLFIFLNIIYFSNAHTISTPQGDIKGTIKKTINGRDVQSFTGIPYAKPPVGDLRFKNPVPFGSWKGVRDGSKNCPICMQNGENIGIKGIIGSEDCLYLDVFTPNFTIPKKYPVIFYIHGGAFTNGGAAFYGPEYLLDKDIILVIINYRLDAFGFAATEDAEMPGNYGLKDQVVALQWVHNNIASYGGNPKSVTIVGHSAGGASVHYQMVSPLSKGLFHRAILMSGSSHCPWALRAPGTVAKRTKQLASLVGCTAEPSKHMLDCLQQVSPQLIIEMNDKLKEWDVDPIIVFTPVVEPKGTEGAFLTVNPRTVKTSIPMLTGITKDEGGLRRAFFQLTGGEELRLSQLDKSFDEIGPITLVFDDTAKNPVEIARKVRKFYFGEKKINKDNLKNLVEMYTDCWFTQCSTSIIRIHEGPAYLYLFNYRGAHSVTDKITGGNGDYGVCHGDELQYLFPLKLYVPNRESVTGKEKKIVDEVVNLWTNFAIHGSLNTQEFTKVR